MKIEIFYAAKFTRRTLDKRSTGKAERVGVVAMTKKVVSF